MIASRGTAADKSPSQLMMVMLANISGHKSPSELSIVARTSKRRVEGSSAVATYQYSPKDLLGIGKRGRSQTLPDPQIWRLGLAHISDQPNGREISNDKSWITRTRILR